MKFLVTKKQVIEVVDEDGEPVDIELDDFHDAVQNESLDAQDVEHQIERSGGDVLTYYPRQITELKIEPWTKD